MCVTIVKTFFLNCLRRFLFPYFNLLILLVISPLQTYFVKFVYAVSSILECVDVAFFWVFLVAFEKNWFYCFLYQDYWSYTFCFWLKTDFPECCLSWRKLPDFCASFPFPCFNWTILCDCFGWMLDEKVTWKSTKKVYK